MYFYNIYIFAALEHLEAIKLRRSSRCINRFIFHLDRVCVRFSSFSLRILALSEGMETIDFVTSIIMNYPRLDSVACPTPSTYVCALRFFISYKRKKKHRRLLTTLSSSSATPKSRIMIIATVLVLQTFHLKCHLHLLSWSNDCCFVLLHFDIIFHKQPLK